MKSTMLKILTASLLCFSGVTLTHAATNHTAKSTHTAKSSKATHHAADSSKSVMQKELRACAKNVRVNGYLIAIMAQLLTVLANQMKTANYSLKPLHLNVI